MTAVVAFDLGLKTTGIAWDGGSDHYTCPAALRSSPITPAKEQARLDWWRQTFAMVLLPHRGCEVWVEAPFVHGKHRSGALGLAMLHGILRGVAGGGRHEVHQVEPSVLKKWATGHGAADKDGMWLAAWDRGMPDDDPDDNEVDAWLLRQYALEQIGQRAA